jgi:hypothetical protein
MTLAAVQPPENLIADFQALQLSIAEDRDGSRTREIYEYMTSCEEKCLEMEIRSTEYEEKHFARMLAEAFAGSAQIVLLAWKKAHGRELTL